MTRALLAACALVLGCGSGTGPDATDTWGGNSASLVLTPLGGEIQYQCGSGRIDGGWTLSKDGTLIASGGHRFGGGLQPPGGGPLVPARYRGTLAGDLLTITTYIVETGEALGPYPMTRGGNPVAEICF